MTSSTVTVLFTDLVGSTEMTFATADYNDVRRAHDALLYAAVEGCGGTVVKGLGDGIMATFVSAVSGINAARAIQQAIHRHNRRGRGPELAVRVGLSIGDVTFEGTDCFGTPVIEAARLCNYAQGHQIVATDLLRALTRDTDTETIGPVSLKGLPEPVDVVEIVWDRVLESETPLPARLAAKEPAFVGRSDMLRGFGEAYTRVRANGERHVILVGGEPGGGKTTVVSRAVRDWHAEGAAIGMGRCEEDVRAPYRPFIEALDHLVTNAPTELLEAHVRRHGASLLPLAPALARRLPALPDPVSTDPESERFLLFSAVADVLAALGADDPVVLFLDDLHWADSATASLLRSLATGSEPARLLIVGTFRDAELAADHPMGQALAALRRVPSIQRIALDGLGTADVVDLIEQWTGVALGADAATLAGDLVAETDGNAFFVTEMIRHLDSTGQFEGLDASASTGTTWELPDSVREVLGERVGRLGPDATAILGTAAVIGLEFDLGLLTGVTNSSDEKVLAVLADAASAALVHEVADAPGRFQFTHALVQHAILADLGATRAVSLHRRVAEMLEELNFGSSSVAELAHHWMQATLVSDTSRARDWARQAGDAALASLAPGDAVAYFRQALLLHEQTPQPDNATRIDLLTSLGTAERLSGDPEHRETLLRACRLAQRDGDGERLAAGALANNGGTFSTFGGVDTDRVAMLEAALQSSATPTERALLLGTLANELTYSGDYPRRRALADEALAAARTTGDKTLVVRVMNLIFYSLWIPDTLAERLSLTEESLAIVEDVDDPLLRFWVAITSYINIVQARRISDSEPLLTDLSVYADRLAQPALQWRAFHTIAARALLAGDADAAEVASARSLELGEQAGYDVANTYFKSQTMCLHWVRGTMAELASRIKGESPRPPNAVASLALILAEAGRTEEATVLLDRATANRFGDLPRDPAYITALALYAEAAILTNHAPAAATLFELLLPFEDQVAFDGVLTMGGLEQFLGALALTVGRAEDAVDRLTRSCDFHAAVGAKFFEARSRLHLAAALRARDSNGDLAAAHAAASEAVAIAEQHGYALVLARAREALG